VEPAGEEPSKNPFAHHKRVAPVRRTGGPAGQLVADGCHFPCCRSSLTVTAGACFLEADTSQEDEADWSHEEQLEAVPQQQEEHQVEPFAPAVIDEGGAVGGGEEVDTAEEHRGDTPFQAASGADFVEEDVCRHPPAQESTGADAGVPQSGQEHDLGLTFAHGISGGRLVLCG
jgi:hypothetical protein